MLQVQVFFNRGSAVTGNWHWESGGTENELGRNGNAMGMGMLLWEREEMGTRNWEWQCLRGKGGGEWKPKTHSHSVEMSQVRVRHWCPWMRRCIGCGSWEHSGASGRPAWRWSSPTRRWWSSTPRPTPSWSSFHCRWSTGRQRWLPAMRATTPITLWYWWCSGTRSKSCRPKYISSNALNTVWVVLLLLSAIVWRWFVGADDLTGALHVLQLQLTPPSPSSLAPVKSRMETFWDFAIQCSDTVGWATGRASGV